MCARPFLVCLALFSAAVNGAVIRDYRRAQATGPLPDYIYRPDPLYEWSVYSRSSDNGVTTVYLSLTSQQWYDETLTNRPVWHHYVIVHVPDVIQHTDAAFLYISSGSNPGPAGNTTAVWRTAAMARSSGMVTGVVTIIPNQPLIFENDGVSRSEDEIIAWTWRRFYNESHVGIDNPEILARMPMCKGSVRAMDAIQEFVLEENGNAISKFMVAGESKRGWTTWLVGAVDSRVVAMAPVVLSCLNLHANFKHYWRSLGAWSWTLYDYWMEGIMGLIDEPEIQAMADIIDPYVYREWMTMPKLMISGASDEFFFPDDYDYFYNDLLGEKYIWLVENSGHSINNSPSRDDYWAMLETFYVGVLQSYSVPTFTWTRQADANGGSVTASLSVTPLEISAWSAPSISARRDFRLAALDINNNPTPTGIVWTQHAVNDLGGGRYSISFQNPASGYLAFFIKMRLPGPNGREYVFSTECNIIPATFPYPDCTGSECQGTLI